MVTLRIDVTMWAAQLQTSDVLSPVSPEVVTLLNTPSRWLDSRRFLRIVLMLEF